MFGACGVRGLFGAFGTCSRPPGTAFGAKTGVGDVYEYGVMMGEGGGVGPGPLGGAWGSLRRV